MKFIISYLYIWIHPLAYLSINTQYHSTPLLVIKDLMSKVTWLTQTTSLTEFFLSFLLFIQNFLQVLELLTIFQIVFLSIYLIKKKIITSTSNNLTIWFSSHPLHCPQPLLLQILTSRMTLLHLSCMCTQPTIY